MMNTLYLFCMISLIYIRLRKSHGARELINKAKLKMRPLKYLNILFWNIKLINVKRPLSICGKCISK